MQTHVWFVIFKGSCLEMLTLCVFPSHSPTYLFMVAFLVSTVIHVVDKTISLDNNHLSIQLQL